jgi:hypothetical protein
MYCRSCGEPLPSDASFCPNCRTQVITARRVEPVDDDYTTRLSAHPTGGLKPPPTTPRPKHINWLSVAIGAGFAFALAAAILFFAVLFSSKPAEPQAAATRQTPAPAQDARPTPANTPAPTPTETPQPTPQSPSPEKGAQPRRESANVDEDTRRQGAELTNANVYTPPAVRPSSRVVVSGQFVVPNLQARYWTFTVPPSPNGATLTGDFTAWGGGNDIDVLVMEASQYRGWERLGSYSYLYNSGYTHQGGLYIPLRQGDYVIVFTNRQAVLTSKSVQAHVTLTFQ